MREMMHFRISFHRFLLTNRAFFLELEYKKAATKKRRSVAELEAIIKSLTEENSRLKQKVEGAI